MRRNIILSGWLGSFDFHDTHVGPRAHFFPRWKTPPVASSSLSCMSTSHAMLRCCDSVGTHANHATAKGAVFLASRMGCTRVNCNYQELS